MKKTIYFLVSTVAISLFVSACENDLKLKKMYFKEKLKILLSN